MEIRHHEWKPVEAKRTVMMWKIQKLNYEKTYIFILTQKGLVT